MALDRLGSVAHGLVTAPQLEQHQNSPSAGGGRISARVQNGAILRRIVPNQGHERVRGCKIDLRSPGLGYNRARYGPTARAAPLARPPAAGAFFGKWRCANCGAVTGAFATRSRRSRGNSPPADTPVALVWDDSTPNSSVFRTGRNRYLYKFLFRPCCRLACCPAIGMAYLLGWQVNQPPRCSS